MFFEDTDSSWVISPVGEVSLAQSSAVGQKHLASKSQSRPLHLCGPSYQQHIAVLESDQSEHVFWPGSLSFSYLSQSLLSGLSSAHILKAENTSYESQFKWTIGQEEQINHMYLRETVKYYFADFVREGREGGTPQICNLFFGPKSGVF